MAYIRGSVHIDGRVKASLDAVVHDIADKEDPAEITSGGNQSRHERIPGIIFS